MSRTAEFAVTRFFNVPIYIFFYRKQISLNGQDKKKGDDVFYNFLSL